MNKVLCSYCTKAPSKLFIECVDCKNVKLCLFCFSCGAEAGYHKKSHRYTVKQLSCFDDAGILNGWAEIEDMELLDAIEQYGLGNWEDIAEKCNGKSAQECFEHYNEFYLNGELGTLLSSVNDHPIQVTDHTAPLQISPEKNLPTLHLDPLEQQMLGYMVLRDDFERDYDNDAESLLARLKVRRDADELEKALLVAHVGIYTQRLQERQKRKEIGRIHGLICRLSAYLINKRVKRRLFSLIPSQLSIKDNTTTRRNMSALSVMVNHNPKMIRHAATSYSGRGKKRVPHGPSFPTPEGPRSCQASPASPPAGSWLAAPFALQSRGPTRGTPLVVPGVVTLPGSMNNGLHQVSTVNSASIGVTGLTAVDDELESYDAFNIHEKLKPFMRYFSPNQAKQFLDSLHREEILKHEIKYLLNLLQRWGNKSCIKSKPLPFHSQVFVSAPKNPEPPVLLQSFVSSKASELRSYTRKKRRRPRTSPWYMKARTYRRR